MTTYRTAIHLGQVQTQSKFVERPVSHIRISSDTNITATAAASVSLLSGYGHLGNLNTSIRRSMVSVPTTPSATFAPLSSELLDQRNDTYSVEQHAQKELEQDEKDAQQELRCYEDAGLLSETTGRTIDIVHYWEV